MGGEVDRDQDVLDLHGSSFGLRWGSGSCCGGIGCIVSHAPSRAAQPISSVIWRLDRAVLAFASTMAPIPPEFMQHVGELRAALLCAAAAPLPSRSRAWRTTCAGWSKTSSQRSSKRARRKCSRSCWRGSTNSSRAEIRRDRPRPGPHRARRVRHLQQLRPAHPARPPASHADRRALPDAVPGSAKPPHAPARGCAGVPVCRCAVLALTSDSLTQARPGMFARMGLVYR